jgi:hypothetical protein
MISKVVRIRCQWLMCFGKTEIMYNNCVLFLRLKSSFNWKNWKKLEPGTSGLHL